MRFDRRTTKARSIKSKILHERISILCYADTDTDADAGGADSEIKEYQETW